MKSTPIFVLAALALLFFSACGTAEQQEKAEAVVATKVLALDVEGMTCGGCEEAIKTTLKKFDGVQAVEANFEKGRAEVTVQEGKDDVQAMIEALDKIGYKAKVADKS